MLKYAALILFLFIATSSKAQTIHLNDLIKLATLSHSGADKYLVEQKLFKAISGHVDISQWIKKDKNLSEVIVKSQWQDVDRKEHGIVNYEVKPATYADVLIDELLKLKFTLKSEIKDKGKHVWLYESNTYTVSVYRFSYNKVGASIELHTK